MLKQLIFDTRTRFLRTLRSKLESLEIIKHFEVGDVRRVEPSLEEGSKTFKCFELLMHLLNKDFEKFSLYD